MLDIFRRVLPSGGIIFSPFLHYLYTYQVQVLWGPLPEILWCRPGGGNPPLDIPCSGVRDRLTLDLAGGVEQGRP